MQHRSIARTSCCRLRGGYWSLSSSSTTATSFMGGRPKEAVLLGGRRWYSYNGARQALMISSAPLLSSSSSSFAAVGVNAFRRSFLDQLLGYSPMSPKPIKPSSSQPSTAPSTDSATSKDDNSKSSIPTAEDVTTVGGIWAPTSAKRTKLGELMAEMTSSSSGQDGNMKTSLDDMATDIEKLDLWLCDGLSAITKAADFVPVGGAGVERSIAKEESSSSSSSLTAVSSADMSLSPTLVLQQQDTWLAEEKSKLATCDLHQVQWEEHLRNFVTQINQRLSTMPSDRYLRDVRDYLDISQEKKTSNDKNGTSSTTTETTTTTTTSLISTCELNDFEMAVVRYRLLMARAAAEMLSESWTILTTVADQDLDRAAVQGESIHAQASTLPVDKLHAVLQSFFAGTASARVDAIWDLLDRDQDGLLNEDEMNQVCELAIRPVHKALEKLLYESLEASPLLGMPLLPPRQAAAGEMDPMTNPSLSSTPPPKPPGWRQRRREAREKKRLTKMFAKTLKQHFSDEVEMPHRLRCIYAWSNKAHQENKIDSVMVDEAGGGWSGRQRYVELHSKISLDEFREVQQVHFTHLDRVGAELIKSFREDLWVFQGKKRTNKELMRDCAMFLTVVCIIDYIIIVS